MNIDETLKDRGSNYGSFLDQSTIACNIKAAMAKSPNWDKLAPDQRECLDMAAVKIARILNGKPDYHDSWHDLVGYFKLVADRLAVDAAAPKGFPAAAFPLTGIGRAGAATHY